MTLFREELLTPQDEDLRVDTLTVDPEDDDDVETYNDDLGENTEVTPLGDEIDEDDIEDIKGYKTGPGDDDDLLDDDDDLLMDDEEVLLDDDDEIVDFARAEVNPDDDDDLLADDDDDDFLDDDDEIANPDVIPVVPDTDDDEDSGTWADDEDDLLSTDGDEDEFTEDDQPGSTTAGLDPNFQTRHPERTTGRMIGHEPGIHGLGDGDF